MQANLLYGILANESAEFEVSVPVNMEPIIVDTGISSSRLKGQLRHAVGTVPFADGAGNDRGAINWNDQCYRVSGTKLISVAPTGMVTVIGDVGGEGWVSLDYSFDRLIIRSGKKLWYYDGQALKQVTDPNLGQVTDAIWIGGYTMFTDGKYAGVTELNDPFSVKPLKYGSAEVDPDPITGLIRVGIEAHVLGRHTIQPFQNTGGTGFPFTPILGAVINVGCVSPSAKTLFGNSYAFVGGGRGDALGVYIAGNGSASKISTRAVDDALSAQIDPTAIVLERRVARDELRLLVHMEKETWIFLAKASEAAGQSVWYRARSGQNSPYRLRNAVQVYGRTLVGDLIGAQIGELSSSVSTHFGDPNEWQFDVGLLYNQGKGAIVNSVELIGLPGRGPEGRAFLSFTHDGETFSEERAISIGKIGARQRRMEWRPRARMRNFAGLRFRGYDEALLGVSACEVDARALNV